MELNLNRLAVIMMGRVITILRFHCTHVKSDYHNSSPHPLRKEDNGTMTSSYIKRGVHCTCTC